MEYIDGCFEGLFDKNVLLFAHTPMEQGEEKTEWSTAGEGDASGTYWAV